LLLSLRHKARENKDFATADEIRDALQALGIQINDAAENSNYTIS